MADKQPAPQVPAGLQPIPALGGSVEEAQEALLSLLEPEEEKPQAEEATPTEDVESTEETQDESLEEEPAEEEEAEPEEEEAEEESEEPEEEEQPEEELYTVRVDGEDVEVTLDELSKGYSRQQDYTKKTQEIAEYRKHYENAIDQYGQEIAEIQANREQYVNALANMVQMEYGQLQQYQNVDWERLREEDQDQYLLKREEYRDIENRMQQTQANIQEETAKQQQEYQANFQHTLQEEYGKLVNILPQWENQQFRRTISNELRDFAKSKGFSNDEIAQLVDHRSILILLEAKAFEEGQATKKEVKAKKLKNKPKVIRTGKPRGKEAADKAKRTAQMKRLRGTGHLDDASALLEDFIDI